MVKQWMDDVRRGSVCCLVSFNEGNLWPPHPLKNTHHPCKLQCPLCTQFMLTVQCCLCACSQMCCVFIVSVATTMSTLFIHDFEINRKEVMSHLSMFCEGCAADTMTSPSVSLRKEDYPFPFVCFSAFILH